MGQRGPAISVPQNPNPRLFVWRAYRLFGNNACLKAAPAALDLKTDEVRRIRFDNVSQTPIAINFCSVDCQHLIARTQFCHRRWAVRVYLSNDRRLRGLDFYLPE